MSSEMNGETKRGHHESLPDLNKTKRFDEKKRVRIAERK